MSTARRSARRPAELPDVRDGLTALERTVLFTLHEVQREKGGRSVSTAELYGRVLERVDLSQGELQQILSRLAGKAR
jgi:hypothetical protein